MQPKAGVQVGVQSAKANASLFQRQGEEGTVAREVVAGALSDVPGEESQCLEVPSETPR